MGILLKRGQAFTYTQIHACRHARRRKVEPGRALVFPIGWQVS